MTKYEWIKNDISKFKNYYIGLYFNIYIHFILAIL